MVEIQEKVQMKYDGGPFVPIPDDLLGTSDAGRFLRLRVSHAGICKLLSGSKWAELYKQVKNPSLSMGPNYKNLLDEIQLQYHHEAKKVLKSDADSAGAGGSAGGARTSSRTRASRRRMCGLRRSSQRTCLQSWR